MCFIPLAACIVLSGLMRASPHGGGCESDPDNFLSPLSKVHGALNNRELFSVSGRWGATKSNSNSLHCLGSLFDSPDQQLKKEVFHVSCLEFCW